ncbi:MAG: proteasome subunit beta [Candidatus Micrarchaeota archaeon]|nr:proteasome subunit beta [Candidatus Micrarchaeota archaeon]
MDTKIKTGTTTVGLVCTDGIVIAAEKRVTVGGMVVVSEDAEKIKTPEKHIAFAAAGLAGDLDALDRILSVEFKLFRMREGRPISVDAAVSFLQNILYQYKFMPFYVAIIMGGVDKDGTPKLYTLDPSGSVTRVKDHTAYGGSGWFSAQAVLDDIYEKTTVNEAIVMAARAINAAKKRDTGSGGGIDAVAITKEGIRRYTPEEVEKLLEKAKRKK